LEDGVWECGEATGGVKAAGIDQAPQVVASLRCFSSNFSISDILSRLKLKKVSSGSDAEAMDPWNGET